jgi:alpha-glucosidase
MRRKLSISTDAPPHGRDWWKGTGIYEIYPLSFKDSDGDGNGDLSGIIDKLPYVASLGVDAVWVCPFFKTPMRDFGYDVSDFYTVDPLFGSDQDVVRLIDVVHSLDLKIIFDMVPCHTSNEHPWFTESRVSNDNDKHDWYIWADAKPDRSPPTGSYFTRGSMGTSATRNSDDGHRRYTIGINHVASRFS